MKVLRSKKIMACMIAGITILSSAMPAMAGTSDSYSTDGAVSYAFSDENNELTIKEAGTYIVSGSCSDGSIKVKKGVTGVTLVLDGLDLTSSDTAPIVCAKSSEVTIIAASDTVNTLTDAAYNNDELYTDNEDAENAVIKCKDGSQVTITGSGTININANGKNGIKSGTTDSETDAANPKDASLTISEVSLNINAGVNDAVNAEQELNIESGNIVISAEDDAIHCDLTMNVGASGDGLNITVNDCNEGIEAATLNVYGGNIVINSTDDCMNAANSDLTDYAFALNISGGSIDAYSASGDGIDSNGTITLSGGEVEVWTASTADNQPIDADSSITVSGGTLLAAGGSSGTGTQINGTYVVFGGSGAMGQNQNGQMAFGGNGNMGPGGNAGFSAEGTGSVSSGSTVAVTDGSGNNLYSTTAKCNASYILFVDDDLNSGETYTLTSGNTAVSATASGSANGQGAQTDPGQGGQSAPTEPSQGQGGQSAPTEPSQGQGGQSAPTEPSQGQESGPRDKQAGSTTTEESTQNSSYIREVDGKMYAFDSAGNMIINATPTIDGKKYWCGSDGVLKSGWLTLGSAELYFDPETYAACANGVYELTKTVNSEEITAYFAFDSNGVLYKNATPVINGEKYYCPSTGVLRSGWLYLGMWKMYFSPEDFTAATGFNEINGKMYLFNKDGVMQNYAGTTIVDGKKYWFSTDDASLKTGWLTLGKWKLYFDPETYAAYVSTTAVIDGATYVFDSNGVSSVA